jgi:sodium-dependent dicarboxylate transporter 2/3/5
LIDFVVNEPRAMPNQRRKLSLSVACIVLYALLINLPVPATLPPAGQRALALAVVAVIAWVFELIPIGISSPLFVMLMPLLGIVSSRDAMSNFMSPTAIFVLCSFCFAAAFIRTGVAYRLSLTLTPMFGSKADNVLLAFMLSTAVVSMALADIPTAVVFASIAVPILQKNNCVPGRSNFGRALMMGIPTAATLGGVGTPAGSGLNVLTLNLLRGTTGTDVAFLQWSAVGIPFVLVLTFVCWWILRVTVPSELAVVRGFEDLEAERQRLGPLTAGERKFLLLFGITMAFWITGYWTRLDLVTVAMISAAALFFPGIDLLTWDEAKERIGWDAVLLVAASYSLAMAIGSTGAANWMATSLLGGLVGLTPVLLLGGVIAFGIFSHYIVPVAAASLAVSVPVIVAVAERAAVSPALLIVPLGFCASCVMLLPIDPCPLATYHHGYWKISDMMKPGLVMSVAWMVLLTGMMWIARQVGIF